MDRTKRPDLPKVVFREGQYDILVGEHPSHARTYIITRCWFSLSFFHAHTTSEIWFLPYYNVWVRYTSVCELWTSRGNGQHLPNHNTYYNNMSSREGLGEHTATEEKISRPLGRVSPTTIYGGHTHTFFCLSRSTDRKTIYNNNVII